MVRALVSSLVTPEGERSINECASAPAVQELRDDGFTSFKYSIGVHAWEVVKKEHT